MIINKLILKNFQLFKDQTINLDRINLITGLNYDSLDEEGIYSGNGSGKSTILSAILFGLFGEVTDINLKELIRIEEKKCSVTIEGSLNNEQFRIIRKIPSELHIFVNNKEKQFNTLTITQKYLNDLFGSDFQHYRTYNLIDNKKEINLLDLGTISLRKALMEFCADQFNRIRQSLLNKKLERETYNVNKRLYHFYLSTKRETILNNGLNHLKVEYCNGSDSYDEQRKIVNNISSEIQTKDRLIYYKKKEIEKLNKGYCPILENENE